MSSRLIYTVSVLPVNTIPANTDNYNAHDVVDSQVGGSVVGQATILVDGTFVEVGTLMGYTYSRTNRYVPVNGLASFLTGPASPKLVYVRHTGKIYDTQSTLGAACTATSTVLIQGGDGAVSVEILPGQMVVLPITDVEMPGFQLRTTSGEILAVEALLFG